MTTHTPGPWTLLTEPSTHDGHDIVRFYVSGKEAQTSIDSNEELQITAGYGGLSDGFTSIEKAEANARLMAAAPELLEALKMMWDSSCTNASSRPSKAAFLAARAAIFKATGST
jgi:hypothetical protein